MRPLYTCTLALIAILFFPATTFSQSYESSILLRKWDFCTSLSVPDANNSAQKLVANREGDGSGILFGMRQDHIYMPGDWTYSDSSQYNYNQAGLLETEINYQFATTSWNPARKYCYTYNAEGLETSILKQNWVIDSWANNEKLTHEYDESGNVISLSQYYWEDNEWRAWSRNLYEYDLVGNIKKITYQIGYITGELSNSRRDIFEYNANNDLILELYQDFSIQFQAWEDVEKFEYKYNIHDLPEDIYFSKWEWMEWRKVERQHIDYDDGLKPISSTIFSWGGDDWINNNLVEIDYNDYYLSSITTFKYWDFDHWVNEIQYFEEHNENENPLLLQENLWQDEEWVPQFKMQYEYNSSSNITHFQWQQWETETTEWYKTIEELYLYNDNQDLIYKEERFFMDQSESFYGNRIFYYYSEPTFLSKLNESEMLVYPNPASDFLYIETSGNNVISLLRLLNVNGQLIQSAPVNYDARIVIDISAVDQGIYILEIIEKEVVTSKTIYITR